MMSAPTISTTQFTLRGRVARDLMTPTPTCVFNTDPLRSAAEFLARNSAVPVVDTDRRVIGVLSRTDLARALSDAIQAVVPSLQLERCSDHEEDVVTEYQPPGKRIGDAMTPHVVTVLAETPIVEVVRILAQKRIGRVFVVDAEQHLLGVVSATDVIGRLSPAE